MELFYPEKLFDLSKERKLFFATVCASRVISIYGKYLIQIGEEENSWRVKVIDKYKKVERMIITHNFKIEQCIKDEVAEDKRQFSNIVNRNINVEDEDEEEEEIVLNSLNTIEEYFNILLETDDVQAKIINMLMYCIEAMSFNSDYDEEAENEEIQWQCVALDKIINNEQEFPFEQINELNRSYNNKHSNWMLVELF